ncbi:alpha-D-xyloside xylohydrolase [Deinococcus metalli]|uniref:alpha-D-xyloside xylohydrolase n=1 Tax=Deinococcus metalli TaxID=1141878 RepID=A0A7W8KD20_9DEIO|nr:alpha-xylosidase [Deinococcus metalli]MBB5375957.1 alpha-D-xyloside xylohydrolase [Deinococcus metalli]GHF35832.1 alpha-xylosidase [Deinococcus metalli]
MKFTDGNWLTLPGVTPAYPAEAYDARQDGHTLELSAPTRPIRHRGDTLEGPMLTVRLSSPLPGVIRVRVTHFEGTPDAGPAFHICGQDAPVDIHIDDSLASLTSGPLRAEVTRFPWSLRFFHEGEPLTRSAGRGLGYVRRDDGRTFVHEGLTLDVGELVYGLGERFTAFVKNGQSVDIWNRDGGTGSDQAYKNVPFYVTSKGYGVFVNDPGAVSFEVASERVSRVQFSVPGEALEYLVIAGPTPAEVLERYTRLTGRPALPPAWSFGLWLSTSFTTDYDEATVTSFLNGMQERELPLSVFHFDCFWMKAFQWCDFQWDPAVFPDPEGMLARLRARGLKVSVWINPYIAQKSPLFAEATREGYLLRREGGGVWQGDLWQPGMGIVDFTNPAAREWFAAHIRRLARQGVDAIKTDFGERIPETGVVWHDGSDPARMHNYYPQLYNQTVFRALDAERPGEATLFARSATAGGQQFPVHWGGDCDSTFESMAESLRGGLSLGLSGFGFWSHDIGGFEGNPPPALYKRWVAFGLLSSHSRLHASTTYRVPWLIDDESVDVLRHFTRLKLSLMPYLWAQAVTAHRRGLPMMRAMVLEFPDDPACATLDRQYVLGDALLVAPVFREDGRVQVYIPAGTWTSLLTGDVVEGPQWRTETHDVMALPLYVRPGTLLATRDGMARPDDDHGDSPLLTLYALADGGTATATVFRPDGSEDFTVEVRRRGHTLHLTRNGRARPYRVRLAGEAEIRDVDGAELELTFGG